MACSEYSEDITSGETFDASGDMEGYRLANAFDDNTSSDWATSNYPSPRWIEVEFGEAKRIVRAKLYNREWSGYCADQVIIKGSNTGSFSGEETTIYTGSSGLTWADPEWKTFDFDNEDNFIFYRLYFESISVETLVIAEIELMECLDEGANEFEGETSDEAILNDTVDGFNLTDTIYDSTVISDQVDAFNLNDEISESAIINDAVDSYRQIEPTISDQATLGDSSDAFNWSEWLRINTGRFVARYYCTLTGANDSTTDIELPISSFQARKRTGESNYLSVVVPGYAYAEVISARPNGEIVIDMAYIVDGVESLREEIIRVDLEQINPQRGPRSRSITLIGHKSATYSGSMASISGCNYAYSYDGSRGFRFPLIDPYLNPGDTLTVEDTGDSLTVDYITYAIAAKGARFMEVRE